MARSPSIVLHVGAHKTGTTLIQKTLQANRWKLRIHGVRYVTRAQVKEIIQLTASPTAQPEINPNHLLDRCGWTHVLLLSHERLIGRFQNFYADCETHARRLFNACQGHSARVIFYVKRQDRFIESCYIQTLQMGSAKSFRQFLDSHPRLTKPLWTPVVDSLSTAFGKKHVTVVPAETLARGADAFVRDFLRIVNPRLSGLRLRPAKTSNPSFSLVACRIAQAANAHLSNTEKQRLRDFLQYGLHEHSQRESACLFSDTERCSLLNACWDDNRRLFDNYITEHDPSLYSATTFQRR